MKILDYEQSLCFLIWSVESGAKKTGRAKVGRTKAVVWAKGEKKGLQTKPQRLTYALLPQRKNAIG